MTTTAGNKEFWFPYIMWWILWAVVHFFLLQAFGVQNKNAFVDALVSNGLLALSGFITFTAFRFYMPGKGNYLYRIIYLIALTAICVFTTKFALQNIFFDNDDYLKFLESSQYPRYMFAFLMIALMGIVSWLRYYMLEQNENKKRKNDAEILLRDAELSNLRQQLQPHFLFNSLNSISALAGSEPEQARKMIQQLSDFLRGTLKKDDTQTVTLQSELEHLQLYLDIEKVRFGHRLVTQIICDDNAKQMFIPPLLLQPVVENAIKFGLYDTLDAVTISILAKASENYLELTISNPFDKATSKANAGTGFGLNSINRRLWLLFGRNDLLQTEQKENIFLTRIKIPQVL